MRLNYQTTVAKMRNVTAACAAANAGRADPRWCPTEVTSPGR